MGTLNFTVLNLDKNRSNKHCKYLSSQRTELEIPEKLTEPEVLPLQEKLTGEFDNQVSC